MERKIRMISITAAPAVPAAAVAVAAEPASVPVVPREVTEAQEVLNEAPIVVKKTLGMPDMMVQAALMVTPVGQ